MTVIDGTNLILGRLATTTAKKIMNNEKIDIVNAEKIVITGTKESLLAKYKIRLESAQKGNPRKGPKYSRMPDKIVKKAIRGMLPWKSSRGKSAYRNLKIHIGVPKEFASVKMETVELARNKLEKGFMTVESVSKLLGAKW